MAVVPPAGIAGLVVGLVIVVMLVALLLYRRRHHNDDRQMFLADHHQGGAALAYTPELYIPQLPEYALQTQQNQHSIFSSSIYQPKAESLPSPSVSDLLEPDDIDDIGPLNVLPFLSDMTEAPRQWSSLSLVGGAKLLVERTEIVVTSIWSEMTPSLPRELGNSWLSQHIRQPEHDGQDCDANNQRTTGNNTEYQEDETQGSAYHLRAAWEGAEAVNVQELRFGAGGGNWDEEAMNC